MEVMSFVFGCFSNPVHSYVKRRRLCASWRGSLVSEEGLEKAPDKEGGGSFLRT